MALPSYWARTGFGSQVSTCDGAPWAKMWTTCRARAGRGGCLGRSGEAMAPSAASAPAPAAAATGRFSAKSVANPKPPKPKPIRFRNWRRVWNRSCQPGADDSLKRCLIQSLSVYLSTFLDGFRTGKVSVRQRLRAAQEGEQVAHLLVGQRVEQ